MRSVLPAGSVALALALSAARPAHGEVKQSAPDSLLIVHAVTVRAPAGAVYRALGQVGQWWNDEHTWSGAGRNLTLDVRAGGCFCEQWDGGSVEHGRVVLAQTDQTLRISAALGPLQELGASGTFTFKLTAASPGTTELDVTYRVSGDPSHGLDKLGPIVDKVLGEQVARLVKFVETGKPT